MTYVYPVMMNGAILAVVGNDRKAAALMAQSASGFGGTMARLARFPKPPGEDLAGTGELVASVSVVKDGHTFLFTVQRWQVKRDRYEMGHRRSVDLRRARL